MVDSREGSRFLSGLEFHKGSSPTPKQLPRPTWLERYGESQVNYQLHSALQISHRGPWEPTASEYGMLEPFYAVFCSIALNRSSVLAHFRGILRQVSVHLCLHVQTFSRMLFFFCTIRSLASSLSASLAHPFVREQQERTLQDVCLTLFHQLSSVECL